MKKILFRGIIILLCGFLAVLAFALWPTKTATVTAPAGDLKNPDLIKQGGYLATLGDCAACHSKPGSAPYSGGAAIESPIGAMYPPNITPDRQHGIGEYSLDDFARALRNGIRKDGVTLYPSMPYPSYARLSDEDIIALYAYFQHGVKADAKPNQANGIPWPLSIRWPVAIWRKAFAPNEARFDAGSYPNETLARGAYIVEGLGHCGTCHTPRAITLQEKGLDGSDPSYLSGGQVIDGWFAPGLHNDTEGLKRWSEEDIVQTLRYGRNGKSVVIGKPMNDVIINSSSLWREEDLQAVAAYLKSLPALKEERDAANTSTNSESIAKNTDVAFLYQSSCASCHGLEGQGRDGVFPALAGNNTVLAPNAVSVIRIVLDGYDVPTIDGSLVPLRMPHFRDRLSDSQIADVVSFTRQSWGNQAKAVSADEVKAVRDEAHEDSK